MSEINFFEQLATINVNEYVEKKGKFSYLSWAWAVDQLRRHDPQATWEVMRFNGMPFMKTECGYFVEVAVTCSGITLSQIHPVLNNNNKPIEKPNAFEINTSIQRCLVKAIALHGLGLYIYAGEDLPDTGEQEPQKDWGALIKAKWQVLAGSLEGYEAFYKKQKAKGVTDEQIDIYLAQKLSEKANSEVAAADEGAA